MEEKFSKSKFLDMISCKNEDRDGMSFSKFEASKMFSKLVEENIILLLHSKDPEFRILVPDQFWKKLLIFCQVISIQDKKSLLLILKKCIN